MFGPRLAGCVPESRNFAGITAPIFLKISSDPKSQQNKGALIFNRQMRTKDGELFSRAPRCLRMGTAEP
jgi:hypothetical protein